MMETDDDNPMTRARLELPADLAAFYYRTNGADLFAHGNGGAPRYRILPMSELELLSFEDGPMWYRLGVASDGSVLAIDLRGGYDDQYRRTNQVRRYGVGVRRTVRHGTVVATSFTEVLSRLLDGGDRFFWE